MIAAVGPQPTLRRKTGKEELGRAVEGGGITATNWISAEPLAGVEKPFPYLTHTTEAHLTRANIIRAELKAVFATLVKGMEILRAEGVYPQSLVGHGGLFKTPGVAENILSGMLGIPVTTRATAGEGGAWGIAELAASLRDGVRF